MPAKLRPAKLARIRDEIAKLRADALVMSDPHAVAWTFNIRGADVAHTPLPLSYALVPKDGRPTVFIDAASFRTARAIISSATPMSPNPTSSALQLKRLAETKAAIAIDAATGADALSRMITAAGGKPVRGSDPVALLKAVKNDDRDRRHAHRA